MRFFIFLVMIVSSSLAFAQMRTRSMASTVPSSSSYANELMTNLSGGIFSSGKACEKCETGSTLAVRVSYLSSWQSSLQRGIEASFFNVSEELSSNGKSETLVDVAGVMAHNLSSDFSNSLFVKGGIGFFSVYESSNSNKETKLGLFVGAGKRFYWLDHVAFAPEVRLTKKGDTTPALSIHALNFAINW